MLIATLMAATTAIAAPPAPPAPPPPPPAVSAVPPTPPAPPVLDTADGPQIRQFEDAAHGRVLILSHRARGEAGRGSNVMTYRTPDGEDVTVVTERPVTRAEAEELRRATPPRPMLGPAEMAGIREQAKRAGEEAAKARDYAALVRKSIRLSESPDRRAAEGWDWPSPPAFGAGPERAELDALRAQMDALREQMKAMREELRAAARRR